jgi:ribonucleoside-diphosphate reductase alpha chain
MTIAPRTDAPTLGRRFTVPGHSPYDGVDWEVRDARLTDHRDGSVAFEQVGVEFPASWSVTASNIVAQKYFRGPLGTPRRERSLRQVIDRVVDTITSWGRRDGYFVDQAEADTFADELRWLLLHQRASFNSPVWFNIGVPGVAQQAAACFILDVEDDLRSILNWYTEEGIIFRGGSGSGANLSKIRSSREKLSGGGTPSGPVSFMRGADASAGTIKSGGTTRRAAKMVILDADHPDIEEFIWCKAREERKARVLRDAGFDMDLDGADSFSVQYQNANNSVRLTDAFMQAALDGRDWELTARTTGEVIERVPARSLLRQIAEAAWECADPGVQFDTTINRWNTTPNAGRIEASNPCFTGDTMVHTDRGLLSFRELVDRVDRGEVVRVYTHDLTHPDEPAPVVRLSTPDAVMVTGHRPVLRLRFTNGMEVRATANHRFFTRNRGFVRADELAEDDQVQILDLPAPPVGASPRLPVAADSARWRAADDSHSPLTVPDTWDDTFAHWLGWLVGAGRVSGNTVTTIYRTSEERDAVLPLHQLFVEGVAGRALKTTVQPDGTTELRISRAPFRRFLEALGVSTGPCPTGVVPWSVFQAPQDAVAAFLRGLFDAHGYVVAGPGTGSHVGLGSASPELLRGVQRLLSTFGIVSQIDRTGTASSVSGFGGPSVEGEQCRYESRTDVYDLRISGAGIDDFAREIGCSVPHKVEALASIVAGWTDRPRRTAAWTTLSERTDDGLEVTYNLSEPLNHSYVVNGLVVSNCSEHLRLANSACNLASLNLLSFLDEDGTFDVEGFEHAVRVTVTAQDILVGASDYPTDKIAEQARAARDIGIGYTNLGAALMALGLPYDSEDGRAWAAAVTGILTGAAAVRSTELAARLGPAPLFHEDAEAWCNVYRMHLQATRAVATIEGQPALNERLEQLWGDAVEAVERVGARNAELSVAAPTGTISFMMDADTTGIEPDLGLVKHKKLVGGGTLEIVNQTVPRALRRLGYPDAQIAEIVAHVAEHHSIVGAPHLDPAHLPVFACAIGDNAIGYDGHLRMMAAVQPFFSGAMSKTVNVPEHTTVEEIEQLLVDAWRSGIKCVALYRDNCKVSQPLSTGPSGRSATAVPGPTEAVQRVVREAARPVRERLPRSRTSRTFEFRVADCKGFVTVGEYADGRPGELFIRVSKQGSTLAGIMDAFAIAVSHGLQYGVPLRAFVEALVGMRFEPAGITDDPEVRIANSLIDYLFRRLALEYLPYEERVELGILATSERLQPTLPGVEEAAVETSQGVELPPHPPRRDSGALSVPAADQPSRPATDAPLCMTCGVAMTRAGSCFVCHECGSTSGCS